MDCKRCGGSMMPETVIKLRRSLFGFRETRSQGAYCWACKLVCPLKSHLFVKHRLTSVAECLRRVIKGSRQRGGILGILDPVASMPLQCPQGTVYPC